MSFPVPKFELGQRVWFLTRNTEIQYEACGFCGGLASIMGENKKERRCPECFGRGEFELTRQLQWVASPLAYTVGQIRVEYTLPEFCTREQDEEIQIRYMLVETGVRGGTLWDEEYLFSTHAEAVLEAIKLNSELDG